MRGQKWGSKSGVENAMVERMMGADFSWECDFGLFFAPTSTIVCEMARNECIYWSCGLTG